MFAKYPMMTYILLGLNALIFIICQAMSFFLQADILTYYGAKVNSAIMRGEYWRFLTPVFLHANLIHIAVNSYSLFILGTLVERLFGPVRYAVIYFIAGIIGFIASFAFSANPSIGASGAIFGLLGAYVYVVMKKNGSFKGAEAVSIAITVGFNLVFGLTQPGIDNFAHLGGLLGGYAAANAVGLQWDKGIRPIKMAFWAIIIVLCAGGVMIGRNMPYNVSGAGKAEAQTQALRIYQDAEKLFRKGDYSGSEEQSRKILALNTGNEELEAAAQSMLAGSLINQRKFKEAMSFAGELTNIKPAEGHYLVGLSLLGQGDEAGARKELEIAVELDSNNQHAKEILRALK